MKKKNILITGGAGFIGSNLADLLIERGYKVTVIDNLTLGKKRHVNPKARFYRYDIRNLKKIKPLFHGIEYVFHLAAQPRIQPSIINPRYSFDNNIMGTINVLIAARDAKVKRIIYSASSSAYGDQKKMPLKENMNVRPKSPYALAKYTGEKMCRMFAHLYGMDAVSLRYFNVYGPRQTTDGAYATVIGIFLRQARNGSKLTIVGNGSQRRDYTNVKDVVRANYLSMRAKKNFGGEVINIGTGKNYSINELAKLILFGSTLSRDKRFGKLTKYIPPRPGESHATLASNKKAKKLLGWQPAISLQDGIKELQQSSD